MFAEKRGKAARNQMFLQHEEAGESLKHIKESGRNRLEPGHEKTLGSIPSLLSFAAASMATFKMEPVPTNAKSALPLTISSGPLVIPRTWCTFGSPALPMRR